MNDPYKGWPTTQETSRILDLTSIHVCSLLAIGRLTGIKIKQPGRGGKGQWLIDPSSIKKEQRYRKSRAAALKREEQKKLRHPGKLR